MDSPSFKEHPHVTIYKKLMKLPRSKVSMVLRATFLPPFPTPPHRGTWCGLSYSCYLLLTTYSWYSIHCNENFGNYLIHWTFFFSFSVLSKHLTCKKPVIKVLRMTKIWSEVSTWNLFMTSLANIFCQFNSFGIWDDYCGPSIVSEGLSTLVVWWTVLD